MVELEAGKEKTFSFKMYGSALTSKGAYGGVSKITIRFGTPDALTFNDSRFVTFLVRNRPTVLTIADDLKVTDNWQARLPGPWRKERTAPLHKTFRCDVLTTAAVNAWKANPDRPGDDPQLRHTTLFACTRRKTCPENRGVGWKPT